MKPHINNILIGLCLVALSGPLSGRAATIWNGPTLSFSKAAFADPTQAVNQDRMTPNVWITRGNSQGIYNAKTEASYGVGSPADTEWAYGTTANYATLTYTPWLTWVVNNPPGSVGRNAVLHLISDNIYIDIKFTSWPDGHVSPGGAFSYDRSTPASGNVPPTVAIVSPTNTAAFT